MVYNFLYFVIIAYGNGQGLLPDLRSSLAHKSLANGELQFLHFIFCAD